MSPLAAPPLKPPIPSKRRPNPSALLTLYVKATSDVDKSITRTTTPRLQHSKALLKSKIEGDISLNTVSL